MSKDTTTELAAALKRIRELEESHYELTQYMWEAWNGALYPLDFLATAAIQRSLNLIGPFVDLIEQKNLIAAAPLLRLQLDNCMRLSAAWLVEDPHSFAMKVFSGIPVYKQRDRDGSLMRDSYLARKLSEEAEWVPRVYRETSGYIHLSEKHIFSIFDRRQGTREEEGHLVVPVTVGRGTEYLPDELFLEASQAFAATTNLFLRYVHGWAVSKDNADRLDEFRNKIEGEAVRPPDHPRSGDDSQKR